MTTKTSKPAVYQTQVTYQLFALTCCNCGVLFGLENGYDDERRKDHRNFYCPNGHPQGYHGPSQLERERDAARQLAERESRRRQYAEQSAQQAREDAERERRSAAAYKGHATRIRNRIANGVCPAGCNRHFDNIQRHIATKHPDFKIPQGGDE